MWFNSKEIYSKIWIDVYIYVYENKIYKKLNYYKIKFNKIIIKSRNIKSAKENI